MVLVLHVVLTMLNFRMKSPLLLCLLAGCWLTCCHEIHCTSLFQRSSNDNHFGPSDEDHGTRITSHYVRFVLLYVVILMVVTGSNRITYLHYIYFVIPLYGATKFRPAFSLME
jgi:hypothetical protein